MNSSLVANLPIKYSNVHFFNYKQFFTHKQGIHVSSTQLLIIRDMIPMRIKMNKMTFEQRKRGLST